MPHDTSRGPAVGYLLLALGAGLVGFAGYGGYVLYPRFELPAVEGVALAGGAALFMGLLGVAIAGLGAGLFADVTFASPEGIALRSIVGVLLIVLGLIQSGVVLGRINIADRLFREPLARRQARLRRERPALGYGLFGFGYVLAGFG
jgi:hypothetical protein